VKKKKKKKRKRGNFILKKFLNKTPPTKNMEKTKKKLGKNKPKK